MRNLEPPHGPALDPSYGQGGRKLLDVGGPDESFFGAVLWLQP